MRAHPGPSRAGTCSGPRGAGTPNSLRLGVRFGHDRSIEVRSGERLLPPSACEVARLFTARIHSFGPEESPISMMSN